MILATLIPGCAQARPKVSMDPYGFRRRFVDPSGRVIDTGNGDISHSEGQGYGMLLAEAEGDRAGFDLIWDWTRKTLARPDGLFSWRYDPKAAKPVTDANNATDGDMLIAWALLRASVRWPQSSYGSASGVIRSALANKAIVEHGGRLVLLPALVGFVTGHRLTLNPSYYVWPALDAFAKADGGKWPVLVKDGERLIAQARFGATRLPTDWIDLAANGDISPAAGRPPRFGFDAIRIPLYLKWSKRHAAAEPFGAFWAGFTGRKAPIPAWIDVVSGEEAPFPVSTGAGAIVQLVLPGAPKPTAELLVKEDYYSNVLATLCLLAASNG
jgi:endoglucanase